jgi:hypothetical protein
MATSTSPVTTVHLIHEVPDFIEKTAALISEEWPRGLNMRYRNGQI